MQQRHLAYRMIIVLLVMVAGGLAIAAFHYKKNSDALWQIVSEKCVPGMVRQGTPAPCQRVDLQHGYATLKDLNGPLQYLLIPLKKISGIESPALLSPSAPNFFLFAWQARGLLAVRRGLPIKDSALSLAINAKYGRTQNQLHIHISCLRPDVRKRLDELAPQLVSHWRKESLRGHQYLLRTLSVSELAQQSAFVRLAGEIPNARSEMGKYGLALAMLPDGRLVLMAIKRNWLMLNRSAEEIQDHGCQILQA